MKYDINIFHYFDIYKREFRKIIVFIIIAIFIAGVNGYRKPVIYRSTLTILSSSAKQQANALGAYLGLPNLTTGDSSQEIVSAILKSRRMSEDINKYLQNKNKSRLWWELDTYVIEAGFAVEVNTFDPELAKDIANFAIKNLDKINQELNITTEIPMVKVLDPATKGVPIKRNVSKKMLSSAMMVFLLYSLFIFFKEFFVQLKKALKK